MLPTSNSIFRIVTEPELKHSQSGMAILSLRLVADNGMKDEQKKKTLWLQATAFGKTAELISQYFRKGSRIEATIEYHTESWETQDGQKRSEIKGIIQRMGFVDKASHDQSQYTGANPRQTGNNSPVHRETIPAQTAPAPIDNSDEIPF